MSSAPRIHVLLPVHNRKATTEKFIRCLLAQSYENWHMILIDDGSKDGTEDMARSLVSSLTVLKGKGNWWWGGALQQGFNWLKRNRTPAEDLVLIINDDTEFFPDFLANAARALKPRSMLLAQLHDQQGNYLESGVHWEWPKLRAVAVSDPAVIDCFSTRGLFMHVGTFIAIGGFHPIILPHYLSDYDLTLRAGRKGFAFQTAPDVFLRYDDTLTGMHGLEGLSIWKTWRRLFSIRSSSNLIYWSSFILLNCPARYVPVNLLRTWGSVLLPIRERLRPYKIRVRYFLGRVKRKIFKIMGLRPATERDV